MTANSKHTSWTCDWRVFFLNLCLAFSSKCSGALTCACHSLADPALVGAMSKKPLVTKGIATRNPGITTRSKDADICDSLKDFYFLTLLTCASELRDVRW